MYKKHDFLTKSPIPFGELAERLGVDVAGLRPEQPSTQDRGFKECQIILTKSVSPVAHSDKVYL